MQHQLLSGGDFANLLAVDAVHVQRGAVEGFDPCAERLQELADTVEPYLWSDDELLTYLNDAQVMLARQESGIAFEATLQVRNRLLSAYQDIMRMGV